MSTVEKDVLKLFIDEASFLAGSKRRQMGFDTTTKRALLHDDGSDTLAWAVSDDSLQALLAGTQTFTGAKTHTSLLTLNGGLTMTGDITGAVEFIMPLSTSSAFRLKDTNGKVYFRANTNTDTLEFGATGNPTSYDFKGDGESLFKANMNIDDNKTGILEHIVTNSSISGSGQSAFTLNSKTSSGQNQHDMQMLTGTGGGINGPTLSFSTTRVAGLVTTLGSYITTNSSDPSVTVDGGALFALKSSWDGTVVGKIIINMGGDTGNKDDASMHLQVAVGGVLTNVINLADTGLVGIGELNPDAKLEIHQPSFTGAIPVLHLAQSDADETLINFGGTTGANATATISTHTTSGAVTHHLKCEINGTTFWIPGSTNNPTA